MAWKLRVEYPGAIYDAFQKVRRGWCPGGEAFRKELLARMSERPGADHYGAERAESAQEKAERIIAAELKRRGWTEAELSKRPRGDPRKSS